MHAIALTHCAGDIERALWEYDLCAYMALQPAALEAAGQLPEKEHYAIQAGLKAGDRARREYLLRHGRQPHTP